MTSPATGLARAERAELCDSALEAGPDAPTLCDGWTVRDLIAHLLIREGSPAAAGIVVPFLARWNETEMRRVAGKDFAASVQRLRSGPPRLSPYAVPRLEGLLNALEYFVHHEDIRRARPGWQPRPLGDTSQKVLWSMVRTAGKGLARRVPVGLSLQNATTGSTVRLSTGDGEATVRGLPSEVTLFLFGRREQADVELLGDDEALARLNRTDLGI
jgi:uncharacterized protein (TIGR03085 family)